MNDTALLRNLDQHALQSLKALEIDAHLDLLGVENESLRALLLDIAEAACFHCLSENITINGFSKACKEFFVLVFDIGNAYCEPTGNIGSIDQWSLKVDMLAVFSRSADVSDVPLFDADCLRLLSERYLRLPFRSVSLSKLLINYIIADYGASRLIAIHHIHRQTVTSCLSAKLRECMQVRQPGELFIYSHPFSSFGICGVAAALIVANPGSYLQTSHTIIALLLLYFTCAYISACAWFSSHFPNKRTHTRLPKHAIQILGNYYALRNSFLGLKSNDLPLPAALDLAKREGLDIVAALARGLGSDH
jgi:hypothetical protein